MESFAAHVTGLQVTVARCGSGQWVGKLFIYLSDSGVLEFGFSPRSLWFSPA